MRKGQNGESWSLASSIIAQCVGAMLVEADIGNQIDCRMDGDCRLHKEMNLHLKIPIGFLRRILLHLFECKVPPTRFLPFVR